MLKKHEIEAALHAEHQAISAGQLKEDNPLDSSESFRIFCEACRRGDLKVCQEKIQEGVNINARDRFDYTPLILASLCGHFEVVRLLLESGALCERDTFQGERCLYNALNDRIRNLLLSYDYSKSRDPLQPLVGHITSLLTRETPQTSDITLLTESKSFRLHKFILSARSPYFAKKLASAPDTTEWRVPSSVPVRALEIAILGLYFGEVNLDFTGSDDDRDVLAGIDVLGRKLEITHIFDSILESDRRLARQRKTEEVERGQKQMEAWFRPNVLEHEVRVDTTKAEDVKWDRQNAIFADCLLCANDEEDEIDQVKTNGTVPETKQANGSLSAIPIGPMGSRTRSPSRTRKQSSLFPAHRAMLSRSEYFAAMFSSPFKEAQDTPHLPIIHLDCSPTVLKVILTFIYTEQANFALDVAIDVLFAADLLFIEKLKVKAATVISTLGNGATSIVESDNPRGETDLDEVVDIYDIIRAGWDTRMPRLEEFGARYIAYRLERYIDKDEFRELVEESAARIQKRQETDTVELIDDIRYYLSERFRMRFEDAGLDELTEEEKEEHPPHTDGHGPKQEMNGHLEKPQMEATTLQEFGVIRTLDGEEVGDEFAQEAVDYQILLGKIDTLLDSLKLDA